MYEVYEADKSVRMLLDFTHHGTGTAVLLQCVNDKSVSAAVWKKNPSCVAADVRVCA